MAARGQDIVSLEEARTAMRIIGSDDAHDALIGAYIDGAAQYVESLCNMGLIDAVVTERVSPSSTTDPLPVAHRSAEIANAQYRDETDMMPDYAPLPTIWPAGGGCSNIVAPAGGWPSSIVLQYTITTPANRIPGTLRASIILLCREMYDMRGEVKAPSWAVTQLIMPWRDMRVGDTGPMPHIALLPPGGSPAPVGRRHLRAAWSVSTAFTAETFATGTDSVTSSIELPASTGHLYLGVWRSNAAGGAPSSVTGRLVFGGIPITARGGLTVAGEAGGWSISDLPQNAALLGGEIVEVS